MATLNTVCHNTALNHSSPGEVCEKNDCFDIVKSFKTVSVPYTKNVREEYTVEVPKKKAVTVNKKVPYTDYETKEKQVPYQYVDRQTVIKNVPVCRTFPVVKNVCTIVPTRSTGLLGVFGNGCVRKKCPRTVYVKKKCCEPRQFCQSTQKTGWKTEKETVPVMKFRNVTETKYKTEKVPEKRYRNRKVTKMVTKTVPVYNVVKKDRLPASVANDKLVKTLRAPEDSARTILPALNIVQAAPPAVTFNLAGSARNARIYSGEYAAMQSNRNNGDVYRNYSGDYAAARDTGRPGNAHRDYSGDYAALRDAGRSENAFRDYRRDYAAPRNARRPGEFYRDFHRIDRNRDGILSYPELAFDMADANKDGVVDSYEYNAGRGVQWHPYNGNGAGDIMQGFAPINRNGDNYQNPLDLAHDYANVNEIGEIDFGDYAKVRDAGSMPANCKIVCD